MYGSDMGSFAVQTLKPSETNGTTIRFLDGNQAGAWRQLLVRLPYSLMDQSESHVLLNAYEDYSTLKRGMIDYYNGIIRPFCHYVHVHVHVLLSL